MWCLYFCGVLQYFTHSRLKRLLNCLLQYFGGCCDHLIYRYLLGIKQFKDTTVLYCTVPYTLALLCNLVLIQFHLTQPTTAIASKRTKSCLPWTRIPFLKNKDSAHAVSRLSPFSKKNLAILSSSLRSKRKHKFLLLYLFQNCLASDLCRHCNPWLQCDTLYSGRWDGSSKKIEFGQIRVETSRSEFARMSEFSPFLNIFCYFASKTVKNQHSFAQKP